MTREEIIKQVKTVELLARKNVSSVLAGNYRTSIQGSGMIFKEARKYVFGESIRQIDWNITARMNEPYVKEVEEDRQREIFILLDISPSMFSGWQKHTKLEYAILTAATILVSAHEAGEKYGLILFSDTVKQSLRSNRGQSHLMQCLENMVVANSQAGEAAVSDPRVAIKHLQMKRKGKYVVFLISDFIDRDVPDDLKYLGERHDVNLLHIYDPLEYNYTPEVKFLATSAEGESASTLVNFGSTGSLSTFTTALQQQCNRLKMHFSSFNTSVPVHKQLISFLHSKGRRLS